MHNKDKHKAETNQVSIFDQIYNENIWGFGSGHGSLPSVTKSYRAFIEAFIRENHIESVVDIGCGDWQFSKLIDWGDAHYTGLDVVESVVQQNQQTFGNGHIAFKTIRPGVSEDIPGGDLLIIKDVLQHLSDKDIQTFIDEVLPKFTFALVTNCILPTEEINKQITAGDFRPLDLRKHPFNLKASVVHTFTGPRVFSRQTRKFFPAWKKLVLLVQPS